ncbi:MAG: hypothetical protein GX945_01420 [Lentisphaerae bacterium]|nr:hypothetical protein [Lentisphaerota bacterium]
MVKRLRRNMDSMDGERAGAVVHRVHNVHRFADTRQSRALGVAARSVT